MTNPTHGPPGWTKGRALPKSNIPACPACKHTSGFTIDSRPAENGRIRRRRICGNCDLRFTTYELSEHALAAEQANFKAFLTRLRALIDGA